MRRFKHKENGRVVRLLEVFEKSGAMLVEYEDDHSTKNYSPSTMKRWWEELPEEKATETVASDETVEAATEFVEKHPKQTLEVVDKTLKKAKEKATKTPSKQELLNVTTILEYIDKAAANIQLHSYIRDKQPGLVNYKPDDGKVVFVVRKGRKSVQMLLKSSKLPSKYSSALESINGFYDKKLVLTELTDKDKSLIDNIIDSMKEVAK